MSETLSATVAQRCESIRQRFEKTRQFTEQLCAPLSAEDCTIQSMPDVSPTRWHLAHTTWFFETFALADLNGYRLFHPAFGSLFNSYYNTVGEPFPRKHRGLLSRPGLDEILDYRLHVERHMSELFTDNEDVELAQVIELGLQHEQQHQELILTDIKHVLSCNPLFPVYRDARAAPPAVPCPLGWTAFDEGIRMIGHDGNGFAYDNETPRHRELVGDFTIADRLVNCGEYLEFMDDGGYRRPDLWLSIGWQRVCDERWQAPMYWSFRDGRWWQFTLSGIRVAESTEPVCHVSYFEADAYARWSDARLPTEAEWEIASEDTEVAGNFADTLWDAEAPLHPSAPIEPHQSRPQMFGDVWQWTASPYTPYPKYKIPNGALGEYNGKFMCNQYVLRGGSCATSKSHMRRTYRNFFPPEARWQFSGIRLAR